MTFQRYRSVVFLRGLPLLLVFLVVGALFGRASVAGVSWQDDLRAIFTLETIHASPIFSPRQFQGGRWAEEGPVIMYIEPDVDEEGATHLISYNLEADAETRLIDGTELYADDVDRLITIEDYAYSRDESMVLIYTDSERLWRENTLRYYYIYDRETGTLAPVSDRDDGFQQFAKFSPDGSHVVFVRNRDLFLVDVSSLLEGEAAEIQLTDTGSPGAIINGTTDWVYEEEFRLRDAWAWSPDGRYISFLQLDESEVRDFKMADLRGQYPEVEQFRYPKAGEDNSEVRVGIIDIHTALANNTVPEPLFFDTGTWQTDDLDREYIPRLGWTPAIDGTHYAWMFRMNRDQNVLDLIYGCPETGDTEVVLTEASDTWLEVRTGFTDLDVGQITYLDDGRHFVWVSERDGYRHLYLYENDGAEVQQLTRGEWDVTDFHGLDEEAGVLYVTGTLESPRERHLYRIDVEGDDAAPQRITYEAGWHSINTSSDLQYYIGSFTNVETPPVFTLHAIDGTHLRDLETNEQLEELLTALELPHPEFITVPGAEGDSLFTYLIKPTSFNEEREYPVLMYVYGGPGSQTVQDSWGGIRQLWHQYLAEKHDIIVASVDNRGTGGRGSAFKTTTYLRLGVPEALDQIAAGQHLGTLPYVDAERIGIWGWSYGAYVTLLAMMMEEGPETFRAGVSVAPVTDWRLYDTIYTERYMSTPQHNEEGYEETSALNYAGRMSEDQRLLLIHGDMDDNVHFQHTAQMADALQAANKQFEFMMYPGRNHVIFGGNTRLHLFTLVTDFLERSLGEPAEQRVPVGAR